MIYEGSFIYSSSGMGDGNFYKSLVYVDTHNGDGARGWIVNKELEARIAQKLRVGMKLNGQLPIYYGGPVDVNSVFILHTPDVIIHSTQQINTELCVTRDKQMIEMFNVDQYPKKWKIVVGHSSWGAGQLESEMLGSRTRGKTMWGNVKYSSALMWSTDTVLQWQQAIEQSAVEKTAGLLKF